MDSYELVRHGYTPEILSQAFLENLNLTRKGTHIPTSKNDLFLALAHTVSDRIIGKEVLDALTLHQSSDSTTEKIVCYFSAEYLPGPQLGKNLINLGIRTDCERELQQIGFDLNEILHVEKEPGLGNGGLGRLASCYMDSLATLGIRAIGYGLRYEFGIFDQQIVDGWQQEVTNTWLIPGNPWEIPRPHLAQNVQFGGHTEHYHDARGNYRVRWHPSTTVRGVPHDTPILGFRNGRCNTLRLWKAESINPHDYLAFNGGRPLVRDEEKIKPETITKVLYPNDEPEIGKKLRLIQEFFLVSCSLQDMVRALVVARCKPGHFAEHFTGQLNDTHPALAIAELMRLLLDEHGFSWEKAWQVTERTFAFTNHTLLPEALEKWPLRFFEEMLPRHLEIIYEINHRFLQTVRDRFPNDEELVRRLSIIDENGERYVRMVHLAVIGSHAINGVAVLHSKLLTREVLPDFYRIFPRKFHNVTNGVTPRRFLALCNPRLASLVCEAIGDGWMADLEKIRALEPFADDRQFQREWQRVKRENKRDLAQYLAPLTGCLIDPESLFDVQAKRIHEYKRPHLNLLHIITLYARLKNNPATHLVPRTFLFGGKAAPGYRMAKLLIKLINSVADRINSDSDIMGRLKVVFIPNFNVKTGQLIYPAADLSEQISLAGKEASGTGNMKFAMNGALTIGTLDGANIEIRKDVGKNNFFLFGLTAQEAQHHQQQGYVPLRYYESIPDLREAVDLIASGHFSPDDPNLFSPLVDHLLYYDTFMLFADYSSYIKTQELVGKAFLDSESWVRKSILNVARIGRFSSDRSIREYCSKIWRIKIPQSHIDR